MPNYRPPGWSKPQLYSVTAPGSGESTTSTIRFNPDTATDTSDPSVIQNAGTVGTGTPSSQSVSPTTYFFDAVMNADHFTQLRLTEHPTQNATSIVDHAYAMPVRIVIDAEFFDTIDSYVAGQYGAIQKSINAYAAFVALQKSRKPLTLTTRLNTYKNMLIEEIRAPQSNQTTFGLRMTLVFRQIIIANTNASTVSARPDQSQNTNGGNVQSSNVAQSISSRHTLPPPAGPSLPIPPSLQPNPQWSSEPVDTGSLNLD